MITDPILARRAVDALEGIRAALEKLAGDADTCSSQAADGWTTAAPMSRAARRALYRTFHAARKTSAYGWVTACGAGATGGTIDTAASRPLAMVPSRPTREATRCDAPGCRQVFALHPANTESSLTAAAAASPG